MPCPEQSTLFVFRQLLPTKPEVPLHYWFWLPNLHSPAQPSNLNSGLLPLASSPHPLVPENQKHRSSNRGERMPQPLLISLRETHEVFLGSFFIVSSIQSYRPEVN